MGRTNKRGFSLVEVMTSTVVLGIGVMAAVRVYGAGSAGRDQSKTRAEASKLVDQRLDALEAVGASNLPACTAGPKTCRNPAGEWTPKKSPVGRYPCSQVLSRPSLKNRQTSQAAGKMRLDTRVWAHGDGDQRQDSRLVKVSVCWKNRKGRVMQVTGTRLVLDRGGAG